MMKKSNWLIILLCTLFGLIGNANALTITGTPTANGGTTPVGTVIGDAIRFFIPLDGTGGVYGVSDYGENSDSAYADFDGPTMDMYLLFNVPVGYSGHTLEFAFTDLDLKPHNDPDKFFERLIFNGGDGLPNDTFESYTVLNSVPNASVTSNNLGSLLTFTGLNIGPGNSWIHLGFEAYSAGLRGKWRNSAEYLTPTLEANPVPEPATMLLLGTGLIGLAGFGRKKFRKN